MSPLQLRNIFRVNPDTGCNTHDLLECPCQELGKSNPLKPIDTNHAQLNDDMDDSDESEPEKGFIAAAQVKLEDINKMDKAVSISLPAIIPYVRSLTYLSSTSRRRKPNLLLLESGHISTVFDRTHGTTFTTTFYTN